MDKLPLRELDIKMRFRYLFALHIRQAHRQIIDVNDLISMMRLDMDRISVDANIDRAYYESTFDSLSTILKSVSDILSEQEKDLFSGVRGIPAPSETKETKEKEDDAGPWIIKSLDNKFWDGQDWTSHIIWAYRYIHWDHVDNDHEQLYKAGRCFIVDINVKQRHPFRRNDRGFHPDETCFYCLKDPRNAVHEEPFEVTVDPSSDL